MGARLLRWLLPSRCLVCGDAARDQDLCASCERDLPRNDPACLTCALPLPNAAAQCGACQVALPPFAACAAALRYASPVDRLLTRFKFHAGLAEGRLLARRMLDDLPVRDADEVMVPLPLHPSRLGQRGYNQALELARPLARAWGLPLRPAALRRIRATTAQTELDAAARRRNVRGAFRVDDDELKGRRVLLIDDVITTGATVREAAATLLAAGAAEVRVIAAARAPPPR